MKIDKVFTFFNVITFYSFCKLEDDIGQKHIFLNHIFYINYKFRINFLFLFWIYKLYIDKRDKFLQIPWYSFHELNFHKHYTESCFRQIFSANDAINLFIILFILFLKH